MTISEEFLDSLEFCWSATVEQNNGIHVSIWYTAWPMSKSRIKKVITVSSDYPKSKIKDVNFCINCNVK